jgi:hypothetical protein
MKTRNKERHGSYDHVQNNYVCYSNKVNILEFNSPR